jgi:hypothetical protein
LLEKQTLKAITRIRPVRINLQKLNSNNNVWRGRSASFPLFS